MRIIFVRHGHHINDCLTDIGNRQAEAVAKRLSGEKIQKVYASTRGRALQTAEYIAKVHNLEVEPLEFMQELSWGSTDDTPIIHNGHPWKTAGEMVANGQDVMSPNWENEEPFCRNKVVSSGRDAWENFDSLLQKLGYKREGSYYRVQRENDKTYVVTSHAGSSSAVISHLFNLPFPFFCHSIRPDFTSVTIVGLSGEEGALISPRMEILNDSRHTETISAEIEFSR